MTRARLAVLGVLSIALPAVWLTVLPQAQADAGPTHGVTVTAGTGTLAQWPAYDAAVDRFALVPSDGSNESLTVTATTSDPAGTVLVDGRPTPSGLPTTVTGLSPGDEVSVIIDDSAGHSAQSWIYLPSTFPTLRAAGILGEGADQVFLTLGNFLTTTPYETVVDGHAVPSWFEQGNGSDLKPENLGDTRYSMARSAPSGGWRIDELDARFHTLRSHQLDSMPSSTDFHDSELLPDGRTLLLGYNSATRDGHGYYDAVIQIVDPDGHAVFTWNSKDHVDPSEAYVDGGFGDYAHINSLQYLPATGDIVASFRNLSQVMLIAGPDDPTHSTGSVIWRLGGQRNDFRFVDDPDAGPCAQHMARFLPNGDLMLFDDGSRDDQSSSIGKQSADMCPDPDDPTGPRIARPQSRVTEYSLDTSDPSDPTATLVWQFVPTNRYAAFAGSQQRLADGTTLVGWSLAVAADGSNTQEPVASLISADGQSEPWKLFSNNWFSYRAAIGPSPDAVVPTASIGSPVDGATYTEGQQVAADYGCTDTGGSNLVSCTSSTSEGASVSTTPGVHRLLVTAIDGAGNQERTVATYTVDPTSRPDAQVRSASGTWVGDDVYGGSARQRVTTRIPHGSVRTHVRVLNDGVAPDRIGVAGAAGNRRFTVRYLHAGEDITAKVEHGRLRTDTLAPGATYSLTMVIHRTSVARNGDQRLVAVTATSMGPTGRHDTVAVTARATKR